ncbi:MAG: hypothetical protein ACYTFQ_32110, partial [Planctomycetota bacterium]
TGGTYNCQLIISDPNAENTPQVVDVTLFLGVRMLHVPSEYSTIQAAIDAAMPSDTVIVADGIYTGPGNRDIDFKGKAITVRSENGPFNCTIDCGGSSTEPHRGFRFHSGEGSTAVVSGFTITNGYGPDEAAVWSDPAGGAIYCQDSDPTISRCIITGNSSGCCGAGAGIGVRPNDKPLHCHGQYSGGWHLVPSSNDGDDKSLHPMGQHRVRNCCTTDKLAVTCCGHIQ